ncbi:LacI family transcriptional regulator [bacterium]|nr:MAG: LacI family transcriptional regulator [bacterium]
MRTTIRDVAEAAGVSAMAVSAVLNGTGRNVKVSREKAEHIRRVARELRYQPNNLARSLRSRKTGMIGVVFQHFDRFGEEQPYYPQLLNGVMAALFPAEYTLALCPKLSMGGEAGSISDGRFDGILWCRPDFNEASLDDIQNSNVPVVMMHAPPGSVPGVPTFCADNYAAMKTAVGHLVQLGHQHIAFVIDDPNVVTVEGQTRSEAFLMATKAANIQGDVLFWTQTASDVASYVASRPPHTALVCFSDTLAGNVLLACERCGVSVPRDLSVVGFDSSSFCEGTRPRLTSLNQPVERMAKAATTHLLTLIQEIAESTPPSPTVSSVYDCPIDVRDSTAPPRSSWK